MRLLARGGAYTLERTMIRSTRTTPPGNGAARRYRLNRWYPFPWEVVGSARVASNDPAIVVEDVLICVMGDAVFALAKRPAGLTEAEWGELLDAAVALVHEADPAPLAGCH